MNLLEVNSMSKPSLQNILRYSHKMDKTGSAPQTIS